MAGLPVELREIRDADGLNGFKLGSAEFTPLKTFLRRDAKKYHAADLAKTYALFLQKKGDEKIIGYVTLICAEVATHLAGEVNGNGVHFAYPGCPAVKIARLAVHSEYQGTPDRWGSKLIDFCLGLVKQEICPKVGCRFVVVDAKKASVGFYKKAGFTILETKENQERPEPVMWVDLTKIPT